MKPSLCYTYCTLLLVSLVSSCTLFILVASETLKPSTATGELQQHDDAGSREDSSVHHHLKEMMSRGPDQPGRVLPIRENRARLERDALRQGKQSSVVKPLKRPAQGRAGRNTLKKDILTEKPNQQQKQDEPPDLKDVIFLETISKNVGVTNSGSPSSDLSTGSCAAFHVPHRMLQLPPVDVYMVVNLYLVAFCYIKWQLSMRLVDAIAKRAGRMRKLTVLVTFCWVALFSQIVAISNLYHDGLQDIPGPPSIITLVDNQHNELKNIESKLEENLAEALKNLSHNNVHAPQSAVPLTDDVRQEQLGASGSGSSFEDPNNGTAETESLDRSSVVQSDENGQPILVMAPMDDGPTRPDTPAAPIEAPSEERIDVSVPLKPLEVNLTEENPMPVFSEWAQKQMAEAEKKLGEVVNASAMKKGTKPAGSKAGSGTMKLRAKNYAAPECGAKIIASNPEAQSTGSVLTAPKDEYLLNPCTSKIWFVVELCEPVQAERIELANFELFSSSPREFTVSVSNRFPTRDWANVGQFTARDERDVQSFLLHPHLFGKFVRVEILSHYNQEHFCPVSLFRVYGTSEFEAFETDNTPLPPEDDDDVDEEEAIVLDGLNGGEHKKGLADKRKLTDEEAAIGGGDEGLLAVGGNDPEVMGKLRDDTTGSVRKGGKNPNNILKTAGEAVMNMVKKAAEALGKSGNDSNDSSASVGEPVAVTDVPTPPSAPSSSCVTLAYTIRCVNCTDHFRARLELLMNCKHNLLTSLLGVPRIERSFDFAQHFVCANVLGFNLPRSSSGGAVKVLPHGCLNMRHSVLNLLPDELVAGLCNTIAFDLKLIALATAPTVDAIGGGEVMTVDQGSSVSEQSHGVENHSHYHQHQQQEDLAAGLEKPNVEQQQQQQQDASVHSTQNSGATEGNVPQEVSPPEDVSEDTDQTVPGSVVESKEDVNMYNIATERSPPAHIDSEQVEVTSTTETSKEQEQQQQEAKEKDDYSNNHHWETIDDGSMLMVGGTAPSGSGATPSGPAATIPTGMGTGQQKVQPESVFLRLSNRIKALERNMSLSGQYLEELSRRYRKQVEELQHSYAKTLHEIHDQNQRMHESEQKLREVNERLRVDLAAFQATVTDWRNIALAVMLVIVLMLLILLILVLRLVGGEKHSAADRRTVVHHQQQLPAPPPQSVIDRELAQVGADAKPIRGRMLRRKSIDGMPVGGSVDVGSSGVIIATAETSNATIGMSPARLRKKRPSEEALNISGTYVNLLIDDGELSRSPPVALERKKTKQKQRKVSAPSMMGAVASSSTPLAGSSSGGGLSYESATRRSISMIEPQEQRWRTNGVDREPTSEQESSGRIDELPYLEDNDEFIIPTASDLSYDEYVPGSTGGSTVNSSGTTPNDLVNGVLVKNGTASSFDDVPDGVEPSKTIPPTKASRRLSSPAFFKTSLLRSSLGSKKRSAKKSSNNSSNGSSSNNTSSNSSNSSNVSSVLRDAVAGGDAGFSGNMRTSPQQDSWYHRMLSSTPSSPSSLQANVSPDGKQQRQRIGKAKSASPTDASAREAAVEVPAKLSVSFNGDLPATVNGDGLERKSSRGSIRRLFRKVF
uniref:SUN domain-containing protein n=1 Tax=Anopheles farauti TaxID=69004 RepID=A0A182Q3R2_9DIPT